MTQPKSMKTKAYVYGVEKLNGYDAWALFKASAAGDPEKVIALLAKDRRLVNAQFWYQFPIHMAVRKGNAEIVKLLLDQGADPGQSRFTHSSWDNLLVIAQARGYGDVETLLTRALKRKFNYSPEFNELKNPIIARHTRAVGAVVRRKPDLAHAADALGNNAVHWSVMTRQLGLIERFVSLGTPINAQRANGQTPLLLAISQTYDYWYHGTRSRNHPSIRNAWVIVGDLLAKGAPYTMSVAAAVGDQERIEQLLRKDDGLARRLDSSRVSPLSYAAREGHAHLVRLLLEHGADPNAPEDLAPDGRALFEACGGNHLEVAELLLEHGANPNAGVDSCGCCLTIGKYRRGAAAKPIQKLLRTYGAHTPPYELSVKDMKRAIRGGEKVIDDEEFLGRVMEKRDLELLNLYLDADPSVVNRMHIHAGIAYPRSPAMIRELLARGLDPNRPDWIGRTFLHACAERADRSAAEIFLDAGADINARDLEFDGTPLATAVRHQPRCEQEDRPKLEKRRRGMVEFLLKRGALTNLPGDQSWATPLAWARKRNLVDIEKVLLEYGATN